MANKTVNVLLKLTSDNFISSLKKCTSVTKEQEKQMKSATNTVNKWVSNANNRFRGIVSTVGKTAAAFAGVSGFLSVAGIKSYASDSIIAFNKSTEAATKLGAVLQNVPSITKKGGDAVARAKSNLIGITKELSKVGVVGSSVGVAGTQQLATFQLSEESLSKLIPGMEDLLAQQKGLNATQEDAVSIGNLIGKAMTGQTGALSKAGIIMTDYQKKVMQSGTEQQRAAMMAEILKDNVGGVNSALAQTPEGKIKNMQNALGGAKIAIGAKLMDLKVKFAEIGTSVIPKFQAAMSAAIDYITPKIDQGIQYVKDHKAQILDFASKAKSEAKKVFTVLKPILQFAVTHAGTILPLMLKIGAGFAVFNVVSGVTTKVLAFKKSIRDIGEVAGGISTLGKKLKEANKFQSLINGGTKFGNMLKLLRMGPMALIIIGILAVVTIGVLLYKNWDTIKEKAQALWDKVTTVFNGIKDAITGAFDKVKTTIEPVITWITDKIDAIKTGFEGVKDFFSGLGWGQPQTNQYTGHNATGTPYWRGGLTHINEGGRGEIVNLPNGTQIIPHDVAKKSVGGTNINVQVTVQGNVIGNRDFMEQTGNYIANKVLAAQGVV